MKTSFCVRTALLRLTAMAVIMSPQWAFAGNAAGGGTMGSNLKSILDQFTDFLTGPLALGIATIMIIIALMGAWFTGGMDSFKKVLVGICILGAILATPAMVNQIWSSMGALV